MAWTEKGQVKMIPSEITAFIHEEMDRIERQRGSIRYGSVHEVHDILEVSSAYERLGLQLLDRGQVTKAFAQIVQAAAICCASENNWRETEWGEILCKPLRGRFFAMFSQCRDLVREHPTLQYYWEGSGLQKAHDAITDPFRVFEREWNGMT